MHSTDRDRRPWWLAAGLGAAVGVLAGLSLARLLPLTLAALLGLMAFRGRSRSAAVAAGAACVVSTLLSLEPEVPVPARLGVATAYAAAGAALLLLVRRHASGRILAGAGAAVVTLGLVAAPTVVSGRDLRPVVVAERQPVMLDVDGAQAYLADEVRDGRLPALVFAAAEDGAAVRYTAFGTTGPGGERVGTTTRFRIGSMSKSFTALAVMGLVAEGRIDLDRPVVDYLDWFDVHYPPGRDPVTVGDLLHHDSGIANSAGWELLAGGGPDPLEHMQHGLAGSPLLAAGEVEYANANFILAAQIIEIVTGETYADHLTDEVLAPLGLTATTPARPTGDDLAEGYRMWFGVPVRSTAPFLDFAVPAGFITSNAVDLLAYLDAVVRSDNPVVTPAIRHALLAGAVPAPHSPAGVPFPGHRFAKGWVRGPIAGTEVVWHSGGLADFNAVMVSHPQGDWAFVILISTASQVSLLMPTITENVTAILTGHEPPRPTAGVTLTDAYLLLDLALIAVALVVAWAASALTSQWRHRRQLRTPVAIGISSALVLAALAFALPALSGFPAAPLSPADQARLARVLTTYVPDVGWSIVLIAAAAAVLLGMSILLTLRRTPTRPPATQRDLPDPPDDSSASRRFDASLAQAAGEV